MVAHAQSLNASPEALGAEGVAIGAPAESMSCTASAGARLAFAPFTVAWVKPTVDRFGRAEMPVPELPMTTGVSSIHSAVSSLEG